MKTLLISIFLIASISVSGQSFAAHKHASDIGRCEVIQKQKTIGQKLRNKIKYNRKRASNE